MSPARDAVLASIRHALAGVGDDEHPDDVTVDRAYRRRDDTPADQRSQLFADRVGEYRATVHRCADGEIAGIVAGVCADAGVATLIVPPGVPAGWRPDTVDVLDDAGHSPRELDRVDAVLTGCAVAIAETGTIVLDAGATQGRRALTLVPDLHVCVVHADQVVMLVPEAVSRLHDAVVAGNPLTLISGPSATSDIELSRVEGVHGPRNLHVVLVA